MNRNRILTSGLRTRSVAFYNNKVGRSRRDREGKKEEAQMAQFVNARPAPRRRKSSVELLLQQLQLHAMLLAAATASKSRITCLRNPKAFELYYAVNVIFIS